MSWEGVAGAAVGGLVTLAGTGLTHWLGNKRKSKIDKARKGLLAKALQNAGGDGWMHIETLGQIVGADLEETRLLLIEIEARGSLKKEKEMWSLISRNPLPGSG